MKKHFVLIGTIYIFVPEMKTKMAGRPKIYDEEKALDKAIEVFWVNGYENTSTENLLKAMGIGKGSFYLAYKDGKQELFEKSMKRFFTKYALGFLEYLKTVDNPIEAIKSYYYTMADIESMFSINGCYFSNTVVQVQDRELKKIAGKHIERIAEAFTEALFKAKKNGFINFEMSEEFLSLYLTNLWHGLNITRNLEKDQKKLIELIDSHFKIFE